MRCIHANPAQANHGEMPWSRSIGSALRWPLVLSGLAGRELRPAVIHGVVAGFTKPVAMTSAVTA